jgi:hypothetical protein
MELNEETEELREGKEAMILEVSSVMFPWISSARVSVVVQVGAL